LDLSSIGKQADGIAEDRSTILKIQRVPTSDFQICCPFNPNIMRFFRENRNKKHVFEEIIVDTIIIFD